MPPGRNAAQARSRMTASGLIATTRSQSVAWSTPVTTTCRAINATPSRRSPPGKQTAFSTWETGSRKRQSTRRSSRLRCASGRSAPSTAAAPFRGPPRGGRQERLVEPIKGRGRTVPTQLGDGPFPRPPGQTDASVGVLKQLDGSPYELLVRSTDSDLVPIGDIESVHRQRRGHDCFPSSQCLHHFHSHSSADTE